MDNATKKSGIEKTAADLQFAFDVGHSSIGWAVLKAAAGRPPALARLRVGHLPG